MHVCVCACVRACVFVCASVCTRVCSSSSVYTSVCMSVSGPDDYLSSDGGFQSGYVHKDSPGTERSFLQVPVKRKTEGMLPAQINCHTLNKFFLNETLLTITPTSH